MFDHCVLTGVRMGGARHHGSAFLSCRFDRARLFDVLWEGCKLTGSQFPGADVRPMTTTGSDWSYTSLRAADLSGLDLSGQRFREADLTDADLRECDLTGADLDRARLQSTKLRGADLRGASMDEVNWRGFELTGVRIDLVHAVQFARAHGRRSSRTDAAQLGGRSLPEAVSSRAQTALRLPSRPRTATAIAHQKPAAKKPRSQSASAKGTSTPAVTPRLTRSARTPRKRCERAGSHMRMPRTNSTPPPSTITSGCHRPLPKASPMSSKPLRTRPQPLTSASCSQSQDQAHAGRDAREDEQQTAQALRPADGDRAGRSTAGRWAAAAPSQLERGGAVRTGLGTLAHRVPPSAAGGSLRAAGA